MEAFVDLRAERLRDAWVQAVHELHEQAQRVRCGDCEPTQVVALLHVLEERAHDAFVSYRDVLLGR